VGNVTTKSLDRLPRGGGGEFKWASARRSVRVDYSAILTVLHDGEAQAGKSGPFA
jgi:hypothetical protein